MEPWTAAAHHPTGAHLVGATRCATGVLREPIHPHPFPLPAPNQNEGQTPAPDRHGPERSLCGRSAGLQDAASSSEYRKEGVTPARRGRVSGRGYEGCAGRKSEPGGPPAPHHSQPRALPMRIRVKEGTECSSEEHKQQCHFNAEFGNEEAEPVPKYS